MAKLKNISTGILGLPSKGGDVAPGETVTIEPEVAEVPGVQEWVARGWAKITGMPKAKAEDKTAKAKKAD